MQKDELTYWIQEKDPDKLALLYEQARVCKAQHVGNNVYLRGLIELSNVCVKDCLYCGIRQSNKEVGRYSVTLDEIRECAKIVYDKGFASLVMQSGERQDPQFVDFIEAAIRIVKQVSNNELRITLSLGEQSRETFERWNKAGAERYLLRIETSSPTLYASLHPQDHRFEDRFDCLKMLREVGYQVGTGFLIGVPGQTNEDLVNDLLFLQTHDIDMIGMGPFLLHPQAPLSQGIDYSADDNFTLGLKMIALTRLLLKDVNIASTTALHALKPQGRELGISAGANIIMPNVTPQNYRSDYALYDNKPNLQEDSLRALESYVQAQGGQVAYGKVGDSAHYCRRHIND